MNSFPVVKCPYCFHKLKYNNVVFRNKTGAQFVDPYLKDYQRVFKGNSAYEEKKYGWTDIGDPKVKFKVKKDDLNNFGGVSELKHLLSDSGESFDERLCPYCHNILPPEFGRYETKYFAIIGAPASGKTTLLASLHNSLKLKHGITRSYHWIHIKPNTNSETSEKSETDTERKYSSEIEKAAAYLNNGKWSGGFATDKVKGPFFYRFTNEHHKSGKINKNIKTDKTDIDLVFYDVPGEYYVNPGLIDTHLKPYLNNADGIIFVINSAETINDIDDDLNSLGVLEAFVAAGIGRNKNVAVMLNKIDEVKSQFDRRDVSDFYPSPVENVISINEMKQYQTRLKNIFLRQGAANMNKTQEYLSSIYDLIDNNFSRNVMMFATSLITPCGTNEDGTMKVRANPDNNCETVLLWLLSEIGVFPSER